MFTPLFSKKQTPIYRKLLPTLALLSAAGYSAVSTAELRLMSETSLSQVTGQAGLTIDIETKVSIAEVEYVDAGSLYWKDYSLTGIGGGLVDNIRATIDLTDGTETLGVGFSDMAMLANMGYLDATETDVAWAIANYDDGNGGLGKQFGDGDLVIHVASTDYGLDFSVPANPADHATNLLAVKNAVDFHLQQGEFGLRSSDKLLETAITKNFSVEAYLGYFDIILKNNGNGYHDTLTGAGSQGEPQGIKLRDSYIQMDLKFRVDDLDVDSTNNATNTFIPRAVTNPGLTLRNMRVHNERGNDTLGSFGFASVESKLAAATGILNNVANLVGLVPQDNYVDGQALYDVNVKWDWDLPHISFGDTGQSVGEVYFTDFHINDTSLVISAH